MNAVQTRHTCLTAQSGASLLWASLLQSHCVSLDALTSFREHKLLVLKMPSHSSNIFQPLDVSFFAPEKLALGQNIRLLSLLQPDYSIDQWDLLPLIILATEKVCSKRDTIVNGFRKSNLFPIVDGDTWCEQNASALRPNNPFSASIPHPPPSIIDPIEQFDFFVSARHRSAPHHNISSFLDVAASSTQIRKMNAPHIDERSASLLTLPELPEAPAVVQRWRNIIGEHPHDPAIMTDESRLHRLLAAKEVKEKAAEEGEKEDREQEEMRGEQTEEGG